MADEMNTVDPAAMVDAVSALKDEVLDAVEEARQRLELDRRMRENPWAVLGVAAGAGFVLGGGLWPVLKPVLKAVGRTAFTPANLVALAAAVGAMRAAQGRAAAPKGEGAAPKQEQRQGQAAEEPLITPATH